MRTTVTIDEDVLTTVEEFAESAGQDIGTTVSSVIRRSIRGARSELKLTFDEKLGIYTLPTSPRNPPLTLDRVNQLRDNE
jgi:hypothetical protein